MEPEDKNRMFVIVCEVVIGVVVLMLLVELMVLVGLGEGMSEDLGLWACP